MCLGEWYDTKETRADKSDECCVGEVDDVELKVGCESAHGDIVGRPF